MRSTGLKHICTPIRLYVIVREYSQSERERAGMTYAERSHLYILLEAIRENLRGTPDTLFLSVFLPPSSTLYPYIYLLAIFLESLGSYELLFSRCIQGRVYAEMYKISRIKCTCCKNLEWQNLKTQIRRKRQISIYVSHAFLYMHKVNI